MWGSSAVTEDSTERLTRPYQMLSSEGDNTANKVLCTSAWMRSGGSWTSKGQSSLFGHPLRKYMAGEALYEAGSRSGGRSQQEFQHQPRGAEALSRRSKEQAIITAPTLAAGTFREAGRAPDGAEWGPLGRRNEGCLSGVLRGEGG